MSGKRIAQAHRKGHQTATLALVFDFGEAAVCLLLEKRGRREGVKIAKPDSCFWSQAIWDVAAIPELRTAIQRRPHRPVEVAPELDGLTPLIAVALSPGMLCSEAQAWVNRAIRPNHLAERERPGLIQN